MTRKLTRCALFAALMALCAWIGLPLGHTVFTMQTFGVWFAFLFLGAGKGTMAVLVYLLLGLMGLPVYAGGTAGPGVLFGANGGYMMGWLLSGLIMWLFERYVAGRFAKIISMIASLLACYTTGTAWFMMIYAQTSEMPGLWTALLWCVIPFVIPDGLKLALAWWADKRLRQIEE